MVDATFYFDCFRAKFRYVVDVSGYAQRFNTSSQSNEMALKFTSLNTLQQLGHLFCLYSRPGVSKRDCTI